MTRQGPDRRPELEALLRRANAVSAANRRMPTVPEVFRQVRWVSEPCREAGAPPCTHRMCCDVCGEASARHVEFGAVQSWQLDHARFHPTHVLYTETLTRPWRARAVFP